MAIHRQAVSPPVPSDEVARIRTELSPQYGAKVHEAGPARVLLIRVPRGEPDPVNDVEEAVEFLQPGDVQDITHCLLIGDERVAQVYARPLVDLMQERIGFDRRQCAAWRERMPGRLGHAIYQSPEDPRRRWRLAVRLPVSSIKEMDEEMLEDLAEGLGPELETPRFKALVAVYLIAAEDDVRLEPDLFVKELLATWQDEERRRRVEADRAWQEEEERRRKERERAALLRDMEGRVGRKRTVRAPLRRAPLLESETTIRPRPEVRHVRQQIDRMARGPWAESVDAAPGEERRLRTTPPSPTGPWLADDDVHQEAMAPLQDGGAPALRGDAGSPVSRADGDRSAPVDGEGPVGPDMDDELPEQLAPMMAAAQQAAEATRQRHDEAHRDLDALRGRVDDALDRARGDEPAGKRPDVRSRSADRTGATLRSGADADGDAPGRRVDEPGAQRMHRTTGGSDLGRLPPDDRTTQRDRRKMAPVDRARATLEDAGFEVMVRPDTPGHVIDLAGEREGGDPQRIVVRTVERLDTGVAKELLKTARELDVDLVLCVAQHIEPEGRRILVATKAKAVSPDEMDRFAF